MDHNKLNTVLQRRCYCCFLFLFPCQPPWILATEKLLANALVYLPFLNVIIDCFFFITRCGSNGIRASRVNQYLHNTASSVGSTINSCMQYIVITDLFDSSNPSNSWDSSKLIQTSAYVGLKKPSLTK